VQARDEFLPAAIEANRGEFTASGVEDAERLLAGLHRHGRVAADFAHVCDFGCGVGRVTIPLAGLFERVTACDVSASHLTVARLDAARAGVRNVVFSLVNSVDFGMVAPFDLWFSTLVLQHNPAPVMVLILRRMFALLAPGGVAVFQVPTYVAGYRFSAAEYLRTPAPELGLEIHVIPQPVVFALAHAAGCVALELREDGAIWPPSLAISNTFMFRKPV
jgi:2-polyprenyl-3-methyl-5-hydroxy-6-metoxy-1,4-benzoquinol methylase